MYDTRFRPVDSTRCITILLLLGSALRIGMLGQNVRLHPDEALYASIARRLSQQGDFLLADPRLDKPPLGIFLVGASFSVFGPTEFAARLPNVYVSILTLAVLYALARHLYGLGIAAFATLLLALSPLDLAFAVTAFHDPPLTLFLLLACLGACQDRWALAGTGLILGVASRTNAVAFVPLIVLLGLVQLARRDWTWRGVLVRVAAFVIPGIVGVALLAWWSAARPVPVDLWTLASINSNPGRLIRANEVLPRFLRWLDLLANVTGFAPLLLLALLPLIKARRSRQAAADLVLGAFVLAILFALWLIAFNTYDRYLHPLGPLILLLVARGTLRLSGKPKLRE